MTTSKEELRSQFAKWYSSNSSRFRGYAKRIGSIDADDIVQEAALVTAEKFINNKSKKTSDDQDWTRYTIRIITIKVADEHRKRRSASSNSEAIRKRIYATVTGDNTQNRRILLNEIREYITRNLTSTEAYVVTAVLSGDTQAQVAEHLGLSRVKINRTYNAGLMKIVEHLKS
ncbi:MAG: sigma-70 family RNA polymerase sigma factor [Myxococcota bacterium]